MSKYSFVKISIFCSLLFQNLLGVAANDLLSFDDDEPTIRSATFSKKSDAWIVSSGNLIATQDGGENWEHFPFTLVDGFRPISFFNQTTGWMVGRKGDVWKTQDGGKDWGIIGKLIPHRESWFFTRQIQFLNESIGWAIEMPSFVWKTVDGGKSWSEMIPFSKLTSESFVSLQFIDQNWGWIGGSQGVLLQTKDGGLTWQQRSRSLSPAVVTQICFVDKTNGWVIAGSEVFSTEDGGRKWKFHLLEKAANQQPNVLSIFFLDKNNGWVVGVDRQASVKFAEIKDLKGIVLRTYNGGRSWNRVNIEDTSSLFTKVYFTDRLHGWITSRNSVYRTTDGGKVWVNKLKLIE